MPPGDTARSARPRSRAARASSWYLAGHGRQQPRAGIVPRGRPFRGVPPDEPQGVLAETRSSQASRLPKNRQQPVGVGQRPGLDRPPEHQRDVRVVAVEAAAKQALDDRQPVRAGQATRRGGELAADGHARVGRRQLGEARGERGGDLPVVAEEPDRPGADVLAGVPQQVGRQPCRRSPPLT